MTLFQPWEGEKPWEPDFGPDSPGWDWWLEHRDSTHNFDRDYTVDPKDRKEDA